MIYHSYAASIDRFAEDLIGYLIDLPWLVYKADRL